MILYLHIVFDSNLALPLNSNYALRTSHIFTLNIISQLKILFFKQILIFLQKKLTIKAVGFCY